MSIRLENTTFADLIDFQFKYLTSGLLSATDHFVGRYLKWSSSMTYVCVCVL